MSWQGRGTGTSIGTGTGPQREKSLDKRRLDFWISENEAKWRDAVSR